MNVRASLHSLFVFSRRTHVLSIVACIGMALLRAEAQEDLTQLSLEELDAVSISAASKRSQSLFETPAAVSVLLPVDIRRAGHASVAESLRLIPGVLVIDQLPSRNTVSIRGGNGLQSTKLLVLVDGRSVYNAFYGDVDWAGADMPFEDLARVEIVRGPGSTLWGANAVNGVINVISKDARDTQGGAISFRAGTAEAARGYARYGGFAGSHTAFRIYAAGSDTRFAAGSLADDPLAGYKQARAGFRADSTLSDRFHLTWQADHAASTRSLNNDPARSQISNLLARLSGKDVAGGELQLQLYIDRFHSRAAGKDQVEVGVFPFSFNESTTNFDLDLTHHFVLGERHDLIWGGGARFIDNEIGSTPVFALANPRAKTWLLNLFVQDEIALIPKKIRLTLGTKLEHHATIDWELLPNARLAWTPNARHTVWAAASRAVRAPSRSEREVLITLADIPAAGLQPGYRVEVAGDPNFDAELNDAYETGWRWRPSARFQTDLAVYRFDYANARNLHETTSFTGPPPVVTQRYSIANDGGAVAEGAELSAHYRVSDYWEIGTGVAHCRTRAEATITNPLVQADYAVSDWLWHVRSWWQLPLDIEFSSTLYGTGENDLAQLPPRFRLDAQLSWHPRPDVELTLGIQNAGDPRHPESITGDATPYIEVRRNVFIRAQWRF